MKRHHLIVVLGINMGSALATYWTKEEVKREEDTDS
jgi:hypothetical protein